VSVPRFQNAVNDAAGPDEFALVGSRAPGDYINDGTFTILQLDANSPTGLSVVGLGTFTVDVVGGTVSAPEPSSLLLLLSGIGAIVLGCCRKRRPACVSTPSSV
jgi:PEP-CTERM motif-containing protein